MAIPTQLRPFLFSDIYSAKGKLRAGMHLIRSRSKTQKDQSLGTFLRGRFGNELVDSLLEPLIAGVYSSDIDQLSLQATFPIFYELEQKHGSLIKGLRASMPERRRNTGKKAGECLDVKNVFVSIVEEVDRRLSEG